MLMYLLHLKILFVLKIRPPSQVKNILQHITTQNNQQTVANILNNYVNTMFITSLFFVNTSPAHSVFLILRKLALTFAVRKTHLRFCLWNRRESLNPRWWKFVQEPGSIDIEDGHQWLHVPWLEKVLLTGEAMFCMTIISANTKNAAFHWLLASYFVGLYVWGVSVRRRIIYLVEGFSAGKCCRGPAKTMTNKGIESWGSSWHGTCRYVSGSSGLTRVCAHSAQLLQVTTLSVYSMNFCLHSQHFRTMANAISTKHESRPSKVHQRSITTCSSEHLICTTGPA